MKIQIQQRKPRNPMVAAARVRAAGAHGQTASASRFEARRALHRELADLHDADRRRASP